MNLDNSSPIKLFYDLFNEVVANWSSRYDAKQMQEMLSTMPNFARCLGPNCSSGQIHDGGDEQPIMTCISCQFKTCYTHQLPWHDGQTCAEYDDMHAERVRQEEQTEA